MGNIHQSALNHDRLTPNGSSFKATALPDFLTTSDGWFRPVSEQVGPDGALWVADWYDKYPCYQNANADPEGVDRERGRIWRVVYTGKDKVKKIATRPDEKMDLGKLTSRELIKLFEHPNEWQRRTAQRLLLARRDCDIAGTDKDQKLVYRGDHEVLAILSKLALDSTKSIETRLAAIW